MLRILSHEQVEAAALSEVTLQAEPAFASSGVDEELSDLGDHAWCTWSMEMAGCVYCGRLGSSTAACGAKVSKNGWGFCRALQSCALVFQR